MTQTIDLYPKERDNVQKNNAPQPKWGWLFFFSPSSEEILEGIGDRRALVPKLPFRFHGEWK